jgi:hypothetical protein
MVIEHALETWKPAITDRVTKLSGDPDEPEEDTYGYVYSVGMLCNPTAGGCTKNVAVPLSVGRSLSLITMAFCFFESLYSVILMHPGIRLDSLADRPTMLGIMAIRWIDILVRVHLNFFMETDLTVYLFDSTNDGDEDDDEPQFLAGAVFHKGSGTVEDPLLTKQPEITMANLRRNHIDNVAYHTDIYQTPITFGQRQWTVFILSNDAGMSDVTVVVVAAAMIFLVSTGLACWFYSSTKNSMDQLVAKAETEKAVFMAESERQAAKNEREINDYIAHEVCVLPHRNKVQHFFLYSGC